LHPRCSMYIGPPLQNMQGTWFALARDICRVGFPHHTWAGTGQVHHVGYSDLGHVRQCAVTDVCARVRTKPGALLLALSGVRWLWATPPHSWVRKGGCYEQRAAPCGIAAGAVRPRLSGVPYMVALWDSHAHAAYFHMEPAAHAHPFAWGAPCVLYVPGLGQGCLLHFDVPSSWLRCLKKSLAAQSLGIEKLRGQALLVSCIRSLKPSLCINVDVPTARSWHCS